MNRYIKDHKKIINSIQANSCDHARQFSRILDTVLLSIKASLCENVFCPSKIGGRKEKDCTFRRKTLKSALSSHRQKSRPEFEIEVKTADKIFSLPTFGKSGLLSIIFWLYLRTKFVAFSTLIWKAHCNYLRHNDWHTWSDRVKEIFLKLLFSVHDISINICWQKLRQ